MLHSRLVGWETAGRSDQVQLIRLSTRLAAPSTLPCALALALLVLWVARDVASVIKAGQSMVSDRQPRVGAVPRAPDTVPTLLVCLK